MSEPKLADQSKNTPMAEYTKLFQVIFIKLRASFTDLLPIILVIAFFQLIILRQPLPQLGEVLFGTLLVIIASACLSRAWKWGFFPSAKPWPMPWLSKAACSG